PGWDALREEELEEDPAVVLTVRDADGNVVRHITGPTTKGIHRVSWSLTYPSTSSWSDGEGPGEDPPVVGAWDDGVLAEPGTYTVRLATRVDGKLVDTGKSQSFEVVPMHDGGVLAGATPSELASFNQELATLQRSAASVRSTLGETERRLNAMAKVLDRSIADDTELAGDVRTLARRIAHMQERLSGHPRRALANDQGPVSISRRLSVVQLGTTYATHGPTPTHRESFDIASRALHEIRAELSDMIRTKIPAIEERLDDAGVPWTPGRVPMP
ncbi:MAG: hypothetical protein AAFO89_09870, partial [Planctomycetota bacterium]